MTHARDFRFYDKKTYFTRILHDIEALGKGDRVLLATMNFDPKVPEVHAITEALRRASERGVAATLCVDAHDFIGPGKLRLGPLWFHADFPERLDTASRNRLQIGEAVRAAGGTFSITNQPHRAHTSPFSGRSHIKTAIINDQIYIGGCNLDKAENIDIMTTWHDKETADWLYGLMQKLAESERTSVAFGGVDRGHVIDEATTLFIDAGVRAQSLIFEQALQLIDEAKEHLLITCQFFPHGITAEHLVQATKRGVTVELRYNRARKHHAHAPLQQAVIWQERLRGRPRHFFDGALSKKLPYLHAKLIATESAALIGSHNYVTEGVKFGTAEIALLVRDAQFAADATETILRQTDASA